MTREEAIKVLEMFLHKQCDLGRTEFAYDQLTIWDAVKMASDALEQAPCEDVVSRAEVKKIAKEMYLEVANMELDVKTISDCISYTSSKCREVLERKLQALPSVTPLSEHEKFILSQMVNSDAKTIEEISLMYQKQLAEIYQQQNFYLNR